MSGKKFNRLQVLETVKAKTKKGGLNELNFALGHLEYLSASLKAPLTNSQALRLVRTADGKWLTDKRTLNSKFMAELRAKPKRSKVVIPKEYARRLEEMEKVQSVNRTYARKVFNLIKGNTKYYKQVQELLDSGLFELPTTPESFVHRIDGHPFNAHRYKMTLTAKNIMRPTGRKKNPHIFGDIHLRIEFPGGRWVARRVDNGQEFHETCMGTVANRYSKASQSFDIKQSFELLRSFIENINNTPGDDGVFHERGVVRGYLKGGSTAYWQKVKEDQERAKLGENIYDPITDWSHL